MQKYLFTRFALLLLVILTIKCINCRRSAAESDSCGKSSATCDVISRLDTCPLPSNLSVSASQVPDGDTKASLNPVVAGATGQIAQLQPSEAPNALSNEETNGKDNSKSHKDINSPKSVSPNKGGAPATTTLGSFTLYYQFASHYLPHPSLTRDNHRRKIAAAHRL